MIAALQSGRESLKLLERMWPIVITNKPRFIDKAALFPGCSFIVGYDTAERIVQSKYYASEEDMLQKLYTLYIAGTRFLVAGRYDKASGQFFTLQRLMTAGVHPLLHPLFLEIPEADFREDLSSTEIRKALAPS